MEMVKSKVGRPTKYFTEEERALVKKDSAKKCNSKVCYRDLCDVNCYFRNRLRHFKSSKHIKNIIE